VYASGNAKQIAALGLTHADAIRLFSQLPAVIRFSQTLLDELFLVNVVRSAPVSGEGRTLHVAQGRFLFCAL
jgi:hypothetical protein